MSNTTPLKQIAQFYEYKDQIVAEMVQQAQVQYQNKLRAYTKIRPRKPNLLYFGYNEGHNRSYSIELEYKNILMLFYHETSKDDTNAVEYCFASEWNADEIMAATDSVLISKEQDEASLFQLSVVSDIGFLTSEIHNALIDFITVIDNDVTNKIENIS
jgi:hypothetical protein